MVERSIRSVDKTVRYEHVTAIKSKVDRAQPIATAYRMGLVSHAGEFPRLVDQMIGWSPDNSESPDRMDALVWALTKLDLAATIVPDLRAAKRAKDRLIEYTEAARVKRMV